ncbi:hypothetical protein HK104_000581 [Borealophlyctis nickersoniae]|nr:hypothetical protein HK104_000581 [Borealophlyctis nickersoniae]
MVKESAQPASVPGYIPPYAASLLPSSISYTSSHVKEKEAEELAALRAVVVPKFNHDTIEAVLDINDRLIEVLTEYQNHGWVGEPEHKIYQQRLQTNLIYLGASADQVLGQASKPLVPVSKMTTPAVSSKRHEGRKRKSKTALTRRREQIIENPLEFLSCLTPPTMISDEYVPDSKGHDPSQYKPVPPFVYPFERDPSSPALPGSDLVPLDPQTVHRYLKDRFPIPTGTATARRVSSKSRFIPADNQDAETDESDEGDEDYVPSGDEDDDEDEDEDAEDMDANGEIGDGNGVDVRDDCAVGSPHEGVDLLQLHKEGRTFLEGQNDMSFLLEGNEGSAFLLQ